MAKKIEIRGGIYGWTADQVLAGLKNAKGDDVYIELDSPGGSIIAGLSIYNKFIEYKKNNPGAKITVRAMGLVASMATVIAVVADKIEVGAGCVWMVHNASMLVIGDYRDMKKAVNILEGFSLLLANIYAIHSKNKKTKEYYQTLMDGDTWLFGKEIIENGFADTLWDDKANTKKDDAIKTAKERVKETTNSEDYTKDLKNMDRLAAMLPSIEINNGKKNIKKEVKMEITQKEVDAAYAKGLMDGEKKMKALVEKVTSYFSNEYPEAIKKLAIKVLNGEEHQAALSGAAAMWDAQLEANKSKAAKDEQQPDIPASMTYTPGAGANEGTAMTENDFQSELKRMKGVQDGGTK